MQFDLRRLMAKGKKQSQPEPKGAKPGATKAQTASAAKKSQSAAPPTPAKHVLNSADLKSAELLKDKSHIAEQLALAASDVPQPDDEQALGLIASPVPVPPVPFTPSQHAPSSANAASVQHVQHVQHSAQHSEVQHTDSTVEFAVGELDFLTSATHADATNASDTNSDDAGIAAQPNVQSASPVPVPPQPPASYAAAAAATALQTAAPAGGATKGYLHLKAQLREILSTKQWWKYVEGGMSASQIEFGDKNSQRLGHSYLRVYDTHVTAREPNAIIRAAGDIIRRVITHASHVCYIVRASEQKTTLLLAANVSMGSTGSTNVERVPVHNLISPDYSEDSFRKLNESNPLIASTFRAYRIFGRRDDIGKCMSDHRLHISGDHFFKDDFGYGVVGLQTGGNVTVSDLRRYNLLVMPLDIFEQDVHLDKRVSIEFNGKIVTSQTIMQVMLKLQTATACFCTVSGFRAQAMLSDQITDKAAFEAAVKRVDTDPLGPGKVLAIKKVHRFKASFGSSNGTRDDDGNDARTAEGGQRTAPANESPDLLMILRSTGANGCLCFDEVQAVAQAMQVAVVRHSNTDTLVRARDANHAASYSDRRITATIDCIGFRAAQIRRRAAQQRTRDSVQRHMEEAQKATHAQAQAPNSAAAAAGQAASLASMVSAQDTPPRADLDENPNGNLRSSSQCH